MKQGETTLNNLQALCKQCNGGKKDLYNGIDTQLMHDIAYMTSARKRLKTYFLHYPDIFIGCDRLAAIGRTRSWERDVRSLREENMDIEAFQPSKAKPNGGYVYCCHPLRLTFA